MPHFYVNPKNINNKNFKIENEQFHYLSNVRRFFVGDEINIFDGLGNSYRAKIDAVDKKEIIGTILSSKTFVLSEKKVSLYTAIPKGERFDWLIEKASEIGISKIVPVIYSRSVIKDLSVKKLERYKKISISASSQSWRADIMPVEIPKKFSEIVNKINNDKNTINILPYESEEKNNIIQVINRSKEIKNINIFIGPEGGFEKNEIDLAISKKFNIVTLGKNILRVETAGIVSASIILALI